MQDYGGQWILTGSQNLLLLESVSQSLAGRSAILNLLPLSNNEIIRFENHPNELNITLLTGGYPRILDQNISPYDFLESYISTYVERDVRMVSRVIDLACFHKFLALCAGRTGQLLNLSSLGSDCGISQPTVKAWLSILETSDLVEETPEGLALFEIKSGITINQNMYRGFDRVTNQLTNIPIRKKTLIYGGSERAALKDIEIRPWSEAYSLGMST